MHPGNVPYICGMRSKRTMESQGIIRKVSEPTEWVSSIVYIRKKNGKLRLCLDPKDLNRAIMRWHYKTPTKKEMAHKLSGAQHFSKLDAKNGYWPIPLDEESQLLTTFHSTFGRFCFRRMPFGLVIPQDVYMQRMVDWLTVSLSMGRRKKSAIATCTI